MTRRSTRHGFVGLPAAALLLTGALGSAAAATAGSAGTSAQKAGRLEVAVVGIEKAAGRVGCALWRRPGGFPNDVRKASRTGWAKIVKRRARCVFEGVEPGAYAISVLHDANRNGRLDTGWFGKPKEGYGFSNNAKPSTFSPPEFRQARFDYDGKRRRMTIRLRY